MHAEDNHFERDYKGIKICTTKIAFFKIAYGISILLLLDFGIVPKAHDGISILLLLDFGIVPKAHE